LGNVFDAKQPAASEAAHEGTGDAEEERYDKPLLARRALRQLTSSLTMRVTTISLGRLGATPGALQALAESGQMPGCFLARSAGGDWGLLDEEDRRLNAEALRDGSRLLSVYQTLRGAHLYLRRIGSGWFGADHVPGTGGTHWDGARRLKRGR
jgi:hypothetical protein